MHKSLSPSAVPSHLLLRAFSGYLMDEHPFLRIKTNKTLIESHYFCPCPFHSGQEVINDKKNTVYHSFFWYSDLFHTREMRSLVKHWEFLFGIAICLFLNFNVLFGHLLDSDSVIARTVTVDFSMILNRPHFKIK